MPGASIASVTSDCPVAARWFDEVREAGQAAAKAAGSVWGVVSIIGDRLAVVGTGHHLGRVKSLVRSGAAKRAGLDPFDPSSKGLVYVVHGETGYFL